MFLKHFACLKSSKTLWETEKKIFSAFTTRNATTPYLWAELFSARGIMKLSLVESLLHDFLTNFNPNEV